MTPTEKRSGRQKPLDETEKLVCRNIQRFKEQSGLSHEALSRRVGCSAAALHKWVRGFQVPRTGQLAKLAAAFGRSPGDFYDENPAPMAKIDVPAVELLVNDDTIDQEALKRLQKTVALFNALHADWVRGGRKRRSLTGFNEKLLSALLSDENSSSP
jgi:transcriptional regulator with XRE-family HTH domain